MARKFFLNIALSAAFLAAPATLLAQSGIVFGQNSGAMTGQLNMGAYAIWSSSAITAARYQINGSTVLAVLQSNSMAIGINAGKLNSATGASNLFVGEDAGAANTDGWYNTFVGFQAGALNIVGNENQFFGTWAGWKNTAGEDNTFVGYAAGSENTTANDNSVVGYQAASYNQTGAANTVFGSNAVFGANGHSFSSSTVIGYKAGYLFRNGAADNILLGFQAGYNIATGTGNVVIGYNKDTSAPDANNELNIGGVLFGNLSAKTIGISTRIPQAALDIVSTGTAQTQFTQVWRDSGGAIISSMSASGVMMANKFVGDGAIPSGMIALFNGNCPAGWTEVTALQGRYVVGVPASGTLGATVGTALTDTENRAVGQHGHDVTDPGHTHTEFGQGTCVSAGGCSVDVGATDRTTGSSTTNITIVSSGTTAGTNAPYIQLRYCQK